MIESRVEECCLVGGPDYMPDSLEGRRFWKIA